MKDIFLENRHPTSFIDKCFRTLDHLYLKIPQLLTAEEKTLSFVFPLLGELSPQTRTKFQEVLKKH